MKVNPNKEQSIITVGNLKTRVIIIDNYFVSTASAIEQATENARFAVETDGSIYPGVRSPLPENYVKTVIPDIMDLVAECYSVHKGAQVMVGKCSFSLITTEPQNLKPLQKIPHIDTTTQNEFAVLHYLNEGEFNGTSFYRHVPTGFEVITKEQEPIYWQSVRSYIQRYESTDAGYVNNSTEQYTKIASVPYQANRMIIYPASLLHSADVTLSSINGNPQTGRLTANIRLLYK